VCEELAEGSYTATVSDDARTHTLCVDSPSALTDRPPCHTVNSLSKLVKSLQSVYLEVLFCVTWCGK